MTTSLHGSAGPDTGIVHFAHGCRMSTAFHELALATALTPLRRNATRRYPHLQRAHALDCVAAEHGFTAWRHLAEATEYRVAATLAPGGRLDAIARKSSKYDALTRAHNRHRALWEAAVAEVLAARWSGPPLGTVVSDEWQLGDEANEPLNARLHRIGAIAPTIVRRILWRAEWSPKQHLLAYYRGLDLAPASTFYTLAGTAHYVRRHQTHLPGPECEQTAIWVECFGHMVDVAPVLTAAIQTCRFDGVVASVGEPAVAKALGEVGFAPFPPDSGSRWLEPKSTSLWLRV